MCPAETRREAVLALEGQAPGDELEEDAAE